MFPPITPGRVVSSFGEKSDSLGEVIDIADCLDFRDGEAVLVAEDWLRAPVEAVKFEEPKEFEWLRVCCLLVPLVREGDEGGGVFIIFLFLKDSGVRPLFCFSEGEGDATSVPDALDTPDALRFP